MTLKHLNKTAVSVLASFVFLILASTAARADCVNQFQLATDDALHMLVIGDSIMWGQGLRDDEKFSSRVKCWLEEKTRREVKVHVEAHSGAVISGSFAAQTPFTSADGEVNLSSPTINEQLDRAIKFYGDARQSPELILMDGCINDVGVKSLLAASTQLEDLRARVKQNCGERMQALLQRVRGSFPSAQIIVTSYYPIVSLQTADNAFLRQLVKELNNRSPDAPRMSDKQMRQRLIVISDEWYQTSTASLAEAVRKTNAASDVGPSTPRVRFVELEFGPEHTFAAPESLLWTFLFASTNNVSGFAKIVVLLSFGTAAYKANDHVRDARIKSCEQTFKKPPKGIKEAKQAKEDRKDFLLICRYASLGHPNHMGALVYTEAIKGQLLQFADRAGWKRDTNNHQSRQ